MSLNLYYINLENIKVSNLFFDIHFNEIFAYNLMEKHFLSYCLFRFAVTTIA